MTRHPMNIDWNPEWDAVQDRWNALYCRRLGVQVPDDEPVLAKLLICACVMIAFTASLIVSVL